jgi:NAD(P)-dependent dehydrogenase (short-subunit alcohol dehydrogenase family)
MELEGRTALITGSTGSGIGRSTAFRLASEGANIILNYGTYHRSNNALKGAKDGANRVVKVVKELGGKALVLPADTRDPDQVKTMVDTGIEKFGAIDILVNNAGAEWLEQDITEIKPDHWRSVLQAEVDGAFYCTKCVLPRMRERMWGRIINISMEGALNWSRYLAEDYALGKAARTWMARAWARHEIKHGITINAIEPGPVAHMTLQKAVDAVKNGVAWRKRKKPVAHDIAELIAFLCSEKSRFISGSVFVFPEPEQEEMRRSK